MPESRFSLLRAASYRSYFLARTTSSFGSAFGTLAVTFAVFDVGGSATSLGVVLGASAVPALVFMLVGGVVGDRLERRRILISTDLVMGVAQLVAALLYFADSLTIPVLAALQFVRGIASSFFSPASTGMMPSIVSRDKLQPANALLGLARNAIGIVAPALAGAVIAIWSSGAALGVDAASFFISAAFVWLLPRSRGAVSVGSGILQGVREGWSAFASRPWVWQMVLSFALYQASVLPAIMLIGPLLADSSGLGAAGWAVILSARAAGSLLAGVLLLRWRPRSPLVASTAVILLDIPFLIAIAAGATLPVQAAAAAVSALGVVCADTLWESTLQRRVPEDVLSRVSSYDWLGSLSMNPLGFVLIGAAAHSIGGVEVLLFVMGFHALVRLALLLSPSLREGREDQVSAPT